MTGFHVTSVETLRPDVEEPLQFGSEQFVSRLWCEDIVIQAGNVLATYQGNKPALLRNGHILSLTTLTCDDFLRALLTELLTECEIDFHDDLGDCRLMARGDLMFALNYGGEPKAMDIAPERILYGSNPVPPQDVLIWRQ